MQVRPVRMKVSRYLAPSSPRGLRYTKVLSAADAVQMASKSHDPSMRTVHKPPGLSADRPGDEKAQIITGAQRPLTGHGLASPHPQPRFGRLVRRLASPEPLFVGTKHRPHYRLDMTLAHARETSSAERPRFSERCRLFHKECGKGVDNSSAPPGNMPE